MDYDPIDLATQRKRKEDLSEASKLARDIEIEDVQWLMSEKRGRRFMHRLLATTGVYRSSFTGNSQTFFNEGSRNIGLIYTADVHQHCSDDFIKMLKENT